MNIGQQILFLIGALGAINGLILSGYLFLHKKRRSLATVLLGISLLMLSLRITGSVFLYFNPLIPKIYLQISLSACAFIGPFLYYFVRSVQDKVTRVPSSWMWVIGILAGVVVLTGILLPYQAYPITWHYVVANIIYAEWFIFLVLTGRRLWPVIRTCLAAPAKLNIAERNYLMLYLGHLLIFLVYLLAAAKIIYCAYITGPIAFTLILYLTIFFHLYGLGPTESTAVKTEKKKIGTDEALVWVDKLEKVIRDKELYKDPNLKLNDLAQQVNITGHQLSQLLNDNLGKSFSTYINEYRIGEACRLITVNEHLTIEAIGYEVGYNSKSTFYTAFKKVMDMTPALYKESLANAN